MALLQDYSVQLGVFVVIVSTYFLMKVLKGRKKYNLPPGPTPLPIVGNLLSLGMTDHYLKFTKLKEKYGPVFMVHLANQPTLILNTSEVAREAYLTHSDDFAGRPNLYSLSEILTKGGRDIIFGQFGPVWKLQRKIAHAALRKYATGKPLEELLHYAFDDIAGKMNINEPVDPMDYNLMLTNNIMSGMCFGKTSEKDDAFLDYLMRFVKEGPEIFGSGFLADFLPIFQHKMLHTKGLKKLIDEMNYLMEYLDARFEEHVQSYNPDNLTDFTYDLIHLWEKAKKEEEEQTVLSKLEKINFLLVMMDMFFAGIDTTRCTLTYFIAYMANYPDIQEKVYQEIINGFGTDGYITLDAKDRLPYTMAVLFESMRIMPIVPLGLPHVTTKDTKIGEYDIPKGTATMLNVWSIHHNPDYFEDPWTFKPERWLDSDGNFQYHPYHFLSFSMGRRVCVGESFAKAEIPMLVAMFLQKFKFENLDGSKISIEGIDLVGLLEPKSYKVHVKPRV